MRSERLWAILSLALAGGIILLVVLRYEDQGVRPSPSPPSPGQHAIGHVNDEAGYSFTYPPSWDLTDDGTASKVTSPDMAAIVSFGLGAGGGMEEASDRFVSSLEDTYEDLEITGTVQSELAGAPATTVTAEATNDAGIRILIQAITVAAPDRNYAISTFTAAGVDSGLSEAVEEIVASFRPPDGSTA
jgi:hypothetical protein